MPRYLGIRNNTKLASCRLITVRCGTMPCKWQFVLTGRTRLPISPQDQRRAAWLCRRAWASWQTVRSVARGAFDRGFSIPPIGRGGGPMATNKPRIGIFFFWPACRTACRHLGATSPPGSSTVAVAGTGTCLGVRRWRCPSPTRPRPCSGRNGDRDVDRASVTAADVISPAVIGFISVLTCSYAC